jgi:NTP pyrophosphatase (non-canonical NTP hydrolase)
VKVAVLLEEAGEVARAVLDGTPLPALVDELTQVAAVAVAWMEAL